MYSNQINLFEASFNLIKRMQDNCFKRKLTFITNIFLLCKVQPLNDNFQ
jgi:hypothetical protein